MTTGNSRSILGEGLYKKRISGNTTTRAMTLLFFYINRLNMLSPIGTEAEGGIMKAIINGITIEGTPQEIMEYQRLNDQVKPKATDSAFNPWQYKPQITSGGTTNKCNNLGIGCFCTGQCGTSAISKMTDSFTIMYNYANKSDETAP